MDRLALPASARCRCDEIELRISAPPLLTSACHCRGCQRMSSSAYSLSVAVPTSGFAVVRGDPVFGGLRNPGQQHFFCPRCMTWMFTKVMPEFVNLRASLLDDTSWFRPFMETWTRTKLPWASTSAVRSYEEFPPMEDYESLIRDFSQSYGRTRAHAEAKVVVHSNQARPFEETTAPALIEVAIQETFAGELSGESTVRALQVRHDDGSATQVSLQRVFAQLDGRKGSFVLQGSGTVERGKVSATWFVVPGSGTEELVGICGEGGFAGEFGKGSTGTLDYWFE
jgi:hypothetical protein